MFCSGLFCWTRSTLWKGSNTLFLQKINRYCWKNSFNCAKLRSRCNWVWRFYWGFLILWQIVSHYLSDCLERLLGSDCFGIKKQVKRDPGRARTGHILSGSCFAPSLTYWPTCGWEVKKWVRYNIQMTNLMTMVYLECYFIFKSIFHIDSFYRNPQDQRHKLRRDA